jgi:hypothetical protein
MIDVKYLAFSKSLFSVPPLAKGLSPCITAILVAPLAAFISHPVSDVGSNVDKITLARRGAREISD